MQRLSCYDCIRCSLCAIHLRGARGTRFSQPGTRSYNMRCHGFRPQGIGIRTCVRVSDTLSVLRTKLRPSACSIFGVVNSFASHTRRSSPERKLTSHQRTHNTTMMALFVSCDTTLLLAWDELQRTHAGRVRREHSSYAQDIGENRSASRRVLS